jgi:hypothetical protein
MGIEQMVVEHVGKKRVTEMQKACQQSVQPTGGIRRRFQAFFWLRAFSALEANLVPPTSG